MSWRHSARALLQRAAASSGVLGSREQAMRTGLTILMYHRVLPDERCRDYHLPSLAMPNSAFREQLDFLSARCRIVTASEGVARLASGIGAGPALVSLTFDDGYADNYSCAAALMRERGVLGTFFVTTGLIGSARRPWFDEAAQCWATSSVQQLNAAMLRVTNKSADPMLERPTLPVWMQLLKALPDAHRLAVVDDLCSGKLVPADALDRMMTPDELRGLAAAGHEIGSHTRSHPLLPQLSDAELDTELKGSFNQLAAWLGSAPAGFCYPNGDHDERVVDATRRAGYGYACTTRTGRNSPAQDRFRLTRIDMNPRRVLRNGQHDELALRSEIALLHRSRR